MSDPPKKPGSLKDRIAAFENKGPAPPPPAPGPRPKPTGGVSWKPRPPSPPSSPPRTSEDGERKAAGMSAADAKESITKGGSLKERMAALQGRGGFGGLPGAAPAGPPPRPSGEKPKWKPPPKPIATPDPPEAEPSAEPKERPQSPPTGETPASEEGAPAPPAVAEAPEGDVAPAEDQEPDPEEEERQRRAAIAARMARLGGARVGFGPPVFGVKPPVKKPSVPKEEKAEGAETTTETQPKSTPDEVPAIKSPDEAKKTEDKPEDYFTPTPPAGASNDSNPSLLSADTPPSAGIKSPTSMPVPSVPRRAAPPRRKTPKSPSPAPAPPPAALQEVEEAAKVAEETAVPTPALKEEDGVEDKDSEGEIKKEEEEKEQPKSEPEGQEAVPVPAPAEAEVKSKVEEDVDKAPVDSHEAKDSALDVDEPAVVPEKVEDKTTHEPEIADAPAQSHSAKEELPEEEETEETKDTKESEVAYLKDDSVDVKQPAVTDEPAALDEPTAKDHVTQLKEHDPEREESEPEEEHAVAQEEHSEKVEESAVGGGEDEDEDDEAARRKRIAERVAKMGGFNPFAGGAPPPPPVRKPSSSSEVTSPIAHASDAPRSPPVPRRKESTDSVSQQHQQQSIGRRTSVDSTNSQSYAQPLRSPPILPTSPKPSLPGRKDSVGSVQSLSQGQEHSARRASRDDDAGSSQPQPLPSSPPPPPPARASHPETLIREEISEEPESEEGGVHEYEHEGRHEYSRQYEPEEGEKFTDPPRIPNPPLVHNRPDARESLSSSSTYQDIDVDSKPTRKPSIPGPTPPISAVRPPPPFSPDSQDASKPKHLSIPPPLSPRPGEVEDDQDDRVSFLEVQSEEEDEEQREEDYERERREEEERYLPPELNPSRSYEADPAPAPAPPPRQPVPSKRTSMPPPPRAPPPAPEPVDEREFEEHVRTQTQTHPKHISRQLPPPPPITAELSREDEFEEKEQDEEPAHAPVHPTRLSHPPPLGPRPPPRLQQQQHGTGVDDGEDEVEEKDSPALSPVENRDNVSDLDIQSDMDVPDSPPSRHRSFSIDDDDERERKAREEEEDEEKSKEEEVLSEHDGDPIDPSFHAPRKSGSMSSMRSPVSPAHGANQPPAVRKDAPPVPEEKGEEEQEQEEEDEEQARRRTIAERMARLGGIRFGAPMPPPVRRPQPPPPQEEEGERGEHVEHQPDQEREEEKGREEEPPEEEDEYARKQRIAARIAGMGGMRLGMLPTAMAPPGVPKRHQEEEPHHEASKREARSPAPPRNVPPPPPPTQPASQEEAEKESEGATGSDDGVHVEAEESELEEVTHEEAEEEAPPPIPTREGRRGSSLLSPQRAPPVPPSFARPPVPPGRPPVPPTERRSTLTEQRPPVAPSYPSAGAGDFVMVDEPEEVEEPPPPPPPRSHRAPPPRAAPPPPPPPPQPAQTDSSQWESLGSSIDFGGEADLSLSGQWSEDSTNYPQTGPSHLPPPPHAKASLDRQQQPPQAQPTQGPSSQANLSADDLMSHWGRVGIQVHEAAARLYEESKKHVVGDGSYIGFVHATLSQVPNHLPPSGYDSFGYLIYAQTGAAVQRRVTDIMPGDIIVLHDAKLKGHKGIQIYHQNVGEAEPLVAVIADYEVKKTKVKVYQANQRVGHQTVESVSYRLEDVKSGSIKIFRVLSA